MTVPACTWPEPCVCFGPFRLYPQQRILLEHEQPVRLGSRAFDILVALVERAGETVTRETLMARVWPDTIVEEANLRVHVAALRKALRAAPRCIDSVAGRGYSFVATVQRHAAPVIPPCAPPCATALVGRAEAIDTLAARVQERRLVTLAGTGGVGKTAVALTVAARLAGRLHA
ncbi:winged helix-turn-helix domain-containing protein, partial [Pseudoduganella buxea]